MCFPSLQWLSVVLHDLVEYTVVLFASACSFQTSVVSSAAVGISHVKPQVTSEPQN